MELNPQFVIDFLQNDPGLDDTSLNLLLPDARGDPQYSNLSQTTPSLDYEITTDVLPSIMQPEQRTSTPTRTEPSSTITTFLNNAKAVSIMFRGKEYCLKYSNSKTLRQTWRCTGRLYVRNPAPSLCIPISDPSSYIYMRHDDHRAECAPKSSERVQRSRVIHSTSSGKTREIARREGTDYNAALRRTRKRHLTSSSM